LTQGCHEGEEGGKSREVKLTQKINDKKTLQDIAIHLYWNLHSGARENIISSLLAASFNLSDEFKKWFLKQIGYGRSPKKLYAEPNKNIGGSIVRAIQQMKKVKGKKFPKLPDIVIYDSDEEKEWDKLEKSDKERDLSKALRSIHLVVVEVKQIGLTPKDNEKYKNLIKGLANPNKLGRESLLNPHRFVIVSSHTKEAKERIIQSPSGEEERRWCWYFKCKHEGVKGVRHLTMQEIYEEIHNNTREWCDDCPILQLFEYYLALYLGIFEDEELHKEYWLQAIKASASAFDLKRDIADHINWLARNASLKTARGKENKWCEKKGSMLKRIGFTKDEKYGRRVWFEYNDKQSPKQLAIVLDGKDHSLDTEKIRNTRDHAEIMKILKKVTQYCQGKPAMM